MERCGTNGCDKPVFINSFETDNDTSDYYYLGKLCYSCSKKKYQESTDAKVNFRKPFLVIVKDILSLKHHSVTVFREKLAFADFSELDLSGSLFIDCNLIASRFRASNLSDSNFLGSNLSNALLANATLENCCLLLVEANYADIEGAKLKNVVAGLNNELVHIDSYPELAVSALYDKKSKACFSKIPNRARTQLDLVWKHGPLFSQKDRLKAAEKSLSDWRHFSCQESLLRYSDLTNASFEEADMRGTDLSKTRLHRTNFSGASLEDCSFSYSSLGNSVFSYTQLDRADFSAAFTSYSLPENEENTPIADFRDADLFSAKFSDSSFLQVSFENVRARRTDFETSFFGPDSVLSGDFTNARFRYSDFIGCDLGKDDASINLRDTDFSHAYFVETTIFAQDMESASFEKCRFETYGEFVGENDQNDESNKSEHSDYLKKRAKRSEIVKEKLSRRYGRHLRHDKITGNRIGGISEEKLPLEPAALKFEGATLGNILLDNIRFKAADFRNASLIIEKNSRCAFVASDFGNAFLAFPITGNPNNSVLPYFELCDFRNALIHNSAKNVEESRAIPEKKRLCFDKCNIASTGFEKIEASQIAFIGCPIEQTAFLDDEVSRLVLYRCTLRDGQYFGYLSEAKSISDAEKIGKNTINGIVDETRKFLSPNNSNGKAQTRFQTDQQFIWNMLASNFKKLALPSLESHCLVRMKSIELSSQDKIRSKKTKNKVCLEKTTTAMEENEDTEQQPEKDGELTDWLRRCFRIYGFFLAALLYSGVVPLNWPLPNELWQGLIAGLVLFTFLFAYFGFPFFSGTWRERKKRQSTRLAYVVYYFGENPLISFLSWGIVMFVFTFVYFLLGVYSHILRSCFIDSGSLRIFDIYMTEGMLFGNTIETALWPDLWRVLVNCAYFSIVTFTTLGFGDLQPVGLAKLYAAIEACIGAVMMALFVYSFARRTAAK